MALRCDQALVGFHTRLDCAFDGDAAPDLPAVGQRSWPGCFAKRNSRLGCDV